MRKLLSKRSVRLVVAFILAIAIWVAVTISNENEYTSHFSVPFAINETEWDGTYAEQIGLRLLDNVSENITLTVKGPWTTVSSLTAADFTIQADYSEIQKAGEQTVSLSAVTGKDVTGCTVSCSPATLTFSCDYWVSKSLELIVDAPSVTVSSDPTIQLGTPVPDVKTEDGYLSVAGPQEKLNQIEKLQAIISAKEQLSDSKSFAATIKAIDKNGKEVNLDGCQISNVEKPEITVMMPVERLKKMKLSCSLKNAPRGIDSSLVTIEPATVEVRGPIEVIDSLGDSIEVTTLNVNNLANEKYEWNVPLKLGNSVTIESGEESVKVSLDLSMYSSKKISLQLTQNNVTITGSGSSSTTVQDRAVTVTLVGKESVLNSIKEEDIRVLVELGTAGNTLKKGTSTYTGRLQLKTNDSVWAYYGETETGMPVYVTVS